MITKNDTLISEENISAVDLQTLLKHAGATMWSKANKNPAHLSTYRLTKGNVDIFVGTFPQVLRFLNRVVQMLPEMSKEKLFIAKTA